MIRTAHVPILDRLLPRASPTRMWRNLMVTSFLGFPPHLGNRHLSDPLKCIHRTIHARQPLYFSTRTEEHLRFVIDRVLYTILFGCLTTVSSFLRILTVLTPALCPRLARSGQLVFFCFATRGLFCFRDRRCDRRSRFD